MSKPPRAAANTTFQGGLLNTKSINPKLTASAKSAVI